VLGTFETSQELAGDPQFLKEPGMFMIFLKIFTNFFFVKVHKAIYQQKLLSEF
jgi:hypothetical protein